MIKKTDVVLTICAYGHSRSVAMVREIQGRGHKATAMGVLTAGPFLSLACAAADTILVMDSSLLSRLPPEAKGKVLLTHVGHDRWVNPYHPQLQGICKRMADLLLILDTDDTIVGVAWHDDKDTVETIHPD